MVTLILHPQANAVELRVEGTITREDYDNVVPQLDPVLADGGQTVAFLVLLENFHGWTPGALMRELVFDLKNRTRLGPVAVVGDGRFTEWTTEASNVFFPSEVRFFDPAQETEAREWLGLPAPPADPAPDAE